MSQHLYGDDCCKLDIPNLEEFNRLSQIYVEAHRKQIILDRELNEIRDKMSSRRDELKQEALKNGIKKIPQIWAIISKDEIYTSLASQIPCLKARQPILTHIAHFKHAFSDFIENEANKKAYGAGHLSSLYEQLNNTVDEIRRGKAQ